MQNRLITGAVAILLCLGVAEDRTGAILMADDVGNTLWRVVPAAQ